MLGSLFNKAEGVYASNFVKKETLAQVFSCETCEVLKENLNAPRCQPSTKKVQDVDNTWLVLVTSNAI